MNKQFRESKYLNESGSKIGNWYLNRLDYFQFHEYPEYKAHKLIALTIGVFLYFSGIKVFNYSFVISLLFFYVGYVALLSYNLLRTKRCLYRGYFLYPRKIVNFLRAREIEVDLNDFDSIATMSEK